MRNQSLSLQVRKINNLEKASRIVQENGLKATASRESKDGVRKFALNSTNNLLRLQTQLRNGSFEFAKQTGILKDKVKREKDGKRARPIVSSPIHNRIVQRAILNILILQPCVEEVSKTPSSFGGIPGKRREDAMAFVQNAIKKGCNYFVRSDIYSFFQKIPRKIILNYLGTHISEVCFLDLIDKATETELENLETIGQDADLFPSKDFGTPQGSSLSMLFGNILLRNFDRELNCRGITCVRYCDDFIILGNKPSFVRKAFDRGAEMLKKTWDHCIWTRKFKESCRRTYQDRV